VLEATNAWWSSLLKTGCANDVPWLPFYFLPSESVVNSCFADYDRRHEPSRIP
jgi:hypothetical protein